LLLAYLFECLIQSLFIPRFWFCKQALTHSHTHTHTTHYREYQLLDLIAMRIEHTLRCVFSMVLQADGTRRHIHFHEIEPQSRNLSLLEKSEDPVSTAEEQVRLGCVLLACLVFCMCVVGILPWRGRALRQYGSLFTRWLQHMTKAHECVLKSCRETISAFLSR